MKSLLGVTVVEMGSVVLAPYAAQILADMGASVIKIEPLEGDSTRHLGHAQNSGMAAVFLNCNRGKQSVCVDLKQREGLAVVHRLAGTADVFLHNMRYETAMKREIAYENLSAINPRLVYCATYGFGAAGRNSRKPAYDDIIQAATGIPAMRERIDGTPAYAPTILADKTTAIFAVVGILGALLEREKSGLGKQLEVPMFETMAHFMSIEHLNGLTWEPPVAPSGYERLLTAFRRPHRTKDGWLAVMPHNEKHWRKFFTLLGRQDVLDDPRFADPASRSRNVEHLYLVISEILPTRTNAEWTEIFTRGDVPFGPMNQLEDLINDPHLEDVGFWQMMDHGTEGRLRAPSFPVRDGGPKGESGANLRPAPALGEDTVGVLSSIGYNDAEIKLMLSRGVVGATG
jgi:crotonobetainyl-CoA:carnitine CoA-transferase CaiB-like acyl-CoA transferase